MTNIRWSLKFCRFEVKLADCWVGVFWRKAANYYPDDPFIENETLDVWLCLLPCLPIHAMWSRQRDLLEETKAMRLP